MAGRARFTFLTLMAAGVLLFMNLPQGGLAKLGLGGSDIWFLDTYAILASSDAVQAGQDPSQPNPLDIYGRPHSYSGWWFLLGDLGFTREDNALLGGLVSGAFLLAVALYLRPQNYWQVGLGLGAVLSPVVLLALNRANNDLVVMAVLVAGLLVLKEGGWRRALMFGVAVLLATGLKFYPLLAAVGLLVLKPSRLGMGAAIGTVAGSALVLWSQWDWFVRAVIPLPEGVYLFGAGVWWGAWGLTGWAPVALTLGGLWWGAWWLGRRGWCQGLADEDGPLWIRAGFAAGAALLIGCWLAGISFAYRWVFALFLLPWLWRRIGAGDRGARLTAVLLLVCLWLDGLFCLTTNLAIGRMPLEQLRSLQRAWQLWSQPLVAALMLACVTWLWNLFCARWRELNLARPRWPAASPRWLWLMVACGWLFFVHSDRSRALLGLPNSETWFLDSYAVLAASDAHHAGLDAAAAGTFDPLGRPHRYSDWWHGLGKLGITRDDNFLFGFTCVVAAMAAITATVRPTTWKEIGWALLVLCSPGVFLGFNRANNDLVVFALLGAALVALRGNQGWRHGLAAGAVALAAGLKFYPVVAALPLFWHHARHGRWKTAWGSAGVVALALLAVWPQMTRGRFPVEVSVHVWGAGIWPQDLGGGAVLAIGLMVAGMAAAFALAVRPGSGPAGRQENPTAALAFMLAGTVLLACFLAGMNYGYRWIFALWLGPWLFSRWQDDSLPPPWRNQAHLLWVLVPVVLWLDGLLCLAVNTGGLVVANRDHAQLQLGWRLITQPVTWLLMGLLASSLIRLGWQSWRVRPVTAGSGPK